MQVDWAIFRLGGVPLSILYDNMKTVIIERNGYSPGEHRFQRGICHASQHPNYHTALIHCEIISYILHNEPITHSREKKTKKSGRSRSLRIKPWR